MKTLKGKWYFEVFFCNFFSYLHHCYYQLKTRKEKNMINRVILTGRPTKKPVLRHTSSGISVTQCNLAVDRQYTNSNGERGADFISLVLWRKNAENFEKFVDKGQLIGIDGRLQSRSYENKDGQKVYVTEVVVDHFSFLESKQNSKNHSSDQSSNSQTNDSYNTSNNNSATSGEKQNNTNSTGNSSKTVDDPFNGTGSIDISDDDLPF